MPATTEFLTIDEVAQANASVMKMPLSKKEHLPVSA
jgi:hypothetical protein